MNSECVKIQVGQSGVYDSMRSILNSNRIPGSRAKGKDNPREGKGSLWEGQQRDANLAIVGDQSVEDDNCQPQEEFGSLEGDKYQDIWRISPRMHAIRGEGLILHVIWIGGELGGYGTDIEVGMYLGNHDGAFDY